MPVTQQQLLALIYDPLSVGLREYLRNFNPFRVLKVEQYEIRHVSTLAWLLDPNETHGFGDGFLALFLQSLREGEDYPQALAEFAACDTSMIRVRREVSTEALMGLVTLREATLQDAVPVGAELDEEHPEKHKGRLDLLVEGERWVLAVEAKVGAVQQPGQLRRYREAIANPNSPHRAKRRALVYLTSDPEDAPHDDEWIHATWQASVVVPLRFLLASLAHGRDADPAVAFARSFLAVAEEHTLDELGTRQRLITRILESHSQTMQDIQQAPIAAAQLPAYNAYGGFVDMLKAFHVRPAAQRAPLLKAMIKEHPTGLRVLGDPTTAKIHFDMAAWNDAWLEPMRHNRFKAVTCELENTDRHGVRFLVIVCDLGDGDEPVNLQRHGRHLLCDFIQNSAPTYARMFSGAFSAGDRPRQRGPQWFTVYRTGWISSGQSGAEGRVDAAAQVEQVKRVFDTDVVPRLKALSALIRQVGEVLT